MHPFRLLLGCALVAACASPPPPARPPLELAPFLALHGSHFPGAARMLGGFAAADDDPRMRVGDGALLGIEVTRGRAVERQLLQVEVTGIPWLLGPDGTPTARQWSRAVVTASTQDLATGITKVEQRGHDIHALQCRMQRSDADGNLGRTREVTLFEEPLAAGFWPYAQPGADPRDSDLAGALTMSLQELAARDPVLQELLFRVVDEPSLWSVATNLGVNVSLRWADPSKASPVVLDDAKSYGDEVRTTTLDLVVNDDVAAFVTLLVTRPVGANRVCGGLVGAIVQNAQDPTRLAVVKLLATRRGK